MAELRLEPRAATAEMDLPRCAAFAVSEIAGGARFVLRGGAAFVAQCSTKSGFELTQPLNRAAAEGERASLRLGPDEWLLLAPAAHASELVQRISASSAAHAYALVDVSHRSATLQLTGPAAVETLASACPLPLSLAHFPLDRCTRTVFARSEVVLWRRGDDRFQIEVQRSFVPYVVTLLQHEARAS